MEKPFKRDEIVVIKNRACMKFSNRPICDYESVCTSCVSYCDFMSLVQGQKVKIVGLAIRNSNYNLGGMPSYVYSVRSIDSVPGSYSYNNIGGSNWCHAWLQRIEEPTNINLLTEGLSGNEIALNIWKSQQ